MSWANAGVDTAANAAEAIKKCFMDHVKEIIVHISSLHWMTTLQVLISGLFAEKWGSDVRRIGRALIAYLNKEGSAMTNRGQLTNFQAFLMDSEDSRRGQFDACALE